MGSIIVSCAVIYYAKNTNEFLVCRPTGERNWSLPKGKIDEDDGGDEYLCAVREMKEETGIGNHANEAGEPGGDGDGVKRCQSNGCIACDLVKLLLAISTLFFELFKIGDDGAQKLEHDGCRDIRHDSKGKDAGSLEVSTHKEV